MTLQAAEISFRQGLAALVDDRPADAVRCFQSAIETERQLSVRFPEPRYLSYYGYSLGRTNGVSPDALRACELAVRHDPMDAALQLNLGRLYAMAGRAADSLQCFQTGLEICPGHPLLRRELERNDRRATPVLAWLPRWHVANRMLGRLRARVLHPDMKRSTA